MGSVQASPSVVNIEPPSAADDFEDRSDNESDNEEDERPLTREELAARTQRKLNQLHLGQAAQNRTGALRMRTTARTRRA